MVHLMAENEEILKECNVASDQYVYITEDNCLLILEEMEPSHKLQRLQHTLNAQFHGAFETMGGEARNCNAARISPYELKHVVNTKKPNMLSVMEIWMIKFVTSFSV